MEILGRSMVEKTRLCRKTNCGMVEKQVMAYSKKIAK